MGKMLTTEETADQLRVTTRTLYDWIKAGKLPTARRVGKKWLIPEEDVQTLLRGEVPAPKPDAGGQPS